MRFNLLILLLIISSNSFSQENFQLGYFASLTGKKTITFNDDHTFEYSDSCGHPYFLWVHSFSEKGIWERHGDTIVLNPHLEEKKYIEHDLSSYAIPSDTNILLTLNHVKRYIDADGLIKKSDTVRVKQADYYFNERSNNKQVRVAEYESNCLWSGAPATQMIVDSNTFKTISPVGKLQKITIGCYELQATTGFVIDDPKANRIVLNIYSNYYLDGQLRRKKILIKNDQTILTEQNKSNKFYTDRGTDHHSKMKKCAPKHKWSAWERFLW